MVETITIETHHDGEWHAAASLSVHSPEEGRKSRTRLTYLDDYIDKHIDAFGTRDQRAVAENYPIGFGVWSCRGWHPFLYDIVPSGAARRWWSARLEAQTHTLRHFGKQLLELPDALAGLGLPDRVQEHPRIHIDDMAETLEKWGLA